MGTVVGSRQPRPRIVRSPGVLLVGAGVLAGAALTGFFLNTAAFSDADGFAAAGRVLLSSNWRHTYANPWLQAGPFEQLICLLGRTLGGTALGEPAALNLIGAAALMLVARSVLGRNWQALLYVGGLATLVGVTSMLYEVGHPSELFIGLLWILAARTARRDQAVAAAVVLGLSAGFETWGLLGAPVLLLLPSVRRTAVAGLLAGAAAALIYAPFALGGDFHMFDLRWRSEVGLDALLFGRGSAFTWQMRLVEAVLVVSLGSVVALLLRKRTAACIWIVPAAASLVRIVLDPVRYPYYWDPAIVLLLIGTAPWITAPRAAAEHLQRRLAAARRAAPPAPVAVGKTALRDAR